MRCRFAPMSVVAPILITLIVFSSLIVASASPSHAVSYKSTASTIQAQDNLPFPPWWRGQCDTNNYSISPSNPNHLPAYTLLKNGPNPTNYRGVFACGPRPLPISKGGDGAPDVPVQFFKGAWTENEWECVELSMRYMYLAYGIKPYSADGYNVVSNYQKYNTNPILVPIANSNPSQYDTVPQPGDIVSYYSNHTAVVTSTTVVNGNGTITLMEQNNSANGIATINVGKNAGLPPWVLDQKIKNWLHHTLDVSPQSGFRGTSVHFSGTGFTANERITITFYASGFTAVVGSATADNSGAFSTTFSIPITAKPGTYFVQATGSKSRRSPQTVFYVLQSHGDWPMVGYDPQLTHYNPTETVLNPTNVSNLTSDWSYSPGYIFGTSVAVVHSIIYISTQFQLEAVDATTHTLKWSFGGYAFDSPTVSNGVVYVGSANGLYAVDALTGTLKWSFTTGTEVQSPVVVKGIAYFGSLDGTFNAVDAMTGALRWKSTGGSIYARPAVANGVVYVSASDGSTYAPLYALDALTGALIWSYLGNANAPTVANGMVYLEASLGNVNGFGLFACDAASGAQHWMFPLTNSTGLSFNTLAVANGVVFAGAFTGNNYNLYAVDATTGGLHWSYSFGTIGDTFPPAIANGVFYIATDYGYLFYALDVATGAKLWNDPQTMGDNISSLVVADGVIYIGTVGDLYTFHLPGTTP
jgi:eukaryotic-like serine/threonine-protein kinase